MGTGKETFANNYMDSKKTNKKAGVFTQLVYNTPIQNIDSAKKLNQQKQGRIYQMHPESTLRQIEFLSAREGYIDNCISNEKKHKIELLELERLKKLQEIEDLKQTKQRQIGRAHV